MPTVNNGHITITPAEIRAAFPAFSDTTAYSDALLNNCIVFASSFISDRYRVFGDSLDLNARTLALELMACHIAILLTQAGNGGEGTTAGASAGAQTSGMVVSARIGDVSVTTAVPDNLSQLSWYLNQTPYGQQLNALLAIHVSPIYFGGSKQRVFNKWR